MYWVLYVVLQLKIGIDLLLNVNRNLMFAFCIISSLSALEKTVKMQLIYLPLLILLHWWGKLYDCTTLLETIERMETKTVQKLVFVFLWAVWALNKK